MSKPEYMWWVTGKKKFRYLGINIICTGNVFNQLWGTEFFQSQDNMERFSHMWGCEGNGDEPSSVIQYVFRRGRLEPVGLTPQTFPRKIFWGPWQNLCMWELGNHSKIMLHRNFFVFKSLFHPKSTWKPSLPIRNDKNVFLMNIAFIPS